MKTLDFSDCSWVSPGFSLAFPGKSKKCLDSGRNLHICYYTAEPYCYRGFEPIPTTIELLPGQADMSPDN